MNSPTLLRVAAYIRPDPGAADRQGDIDHQRRVLDDWICTNLKTAPVQLTCFLEGPVEIGPTPWPAREKLLAQLEARAFDIVVVEKLVRCAKSLAHAHILMRACERAGGRFVSLSEQIDTGAPTGNYAATLLAFLLEFEGDVRREQAVAGIQAARKRGVRLGRPSLPGDLVRQVLAARAAGKTLRELSREYGVSIAAISRAEDAARLANNKEPKP